VRECARQGGKRWSLWDWLRETPRAVRRRPYCCGSWRCEGDCARHDAAVLFARLSEAVARPEYAPDGWVYFVLTLDRDGYYSRRPWRDVNEAYDALSELTNKFKKRLDRWLRKRGWRVSGSHHAMVIEMHRSGFPHANWLVYAPELAAELERWRKAKVADGASDREATLLSDELLDHATQSGWGKQSTAERVRDRNAVAGYLVKLSGQMGSTMGELAKMTQAPLTAPKSFRRLRPGQKFLPERRKSERSTGTIIKRVRDPQRAAYAAEPLVIHKNAEIPLACAALEETVIAYEHHARRFATQTGVPYSVVAPPAVQHFHLERSKGGQR
jgi:hypothetical protein